MSETIFKQVGDPLREKIINAEDLDRRKQFVDLNNEDIARLATVQKIIIGQVDFLTNSFFEFLSSMPEAKGLFADPAALAEMKALKRQHLLAMTRGEFGAEYVEQRLRLGRLYSKYGLDMRLFLGAFHRLMRSVGELIMRDFKGTGVEAFQAFMSFKKIAFIDIGIIIDVITYDRERTIRQQQEAIRELSTPVLQLRERLLMLPIVGMIDTYRARLLTENLLKMIRSARAKVVVIDVTGVALMDSKVANHLVQTVAACRLMGAQVIITGLSAEIAHTLVILGVDLDKFNTVGDLQGGIDEADRILGYRVSKIEGSSHSVGSFPAVYGEA